MIMKNSWQTKKLGEVILDIKDGGTPSRQRSEYFGGDIYWSVIKDIKPQIYDTTEKLTQEGLDHCSAKVWPINSVIISLGATIGQIGIAKVSTATKQGISGIVVNKKIITPEFLVYVLTDKKEYIQKIATGATIKEVRPTKLKEVLTFSLPSLKEQKRIVKILDKVFKKIAKTEENVKKNLQNAKEVFESYLQNVFTNPGKDWEEKRLGEVYDVRDGTHDSPKYHKEGYALITSKNLKRDKLDFKNIKYISEKDYQKINNRSNVHKGDILFAMIGTIGNSVVVEIDPDFAIKNVALFKIPKNQSSYFLKYFLDSKFVIDKMAEESKGTTQKFVGLGYLRDFKIQLPKLAKQKTIVAKLDALSAETKKLEGIYRQKLADLEELKKSVLKKAFEGEL
ncbi:restriction endonuclease subunit S [Patescibacteria group bacterium]|nr:restriction endonuclease subunit S [Patescibacteria group bacterium]